MVQLNYVVVFQDSDFAIIPSSSLFSTHLTPVAPNLFGTRDQSHGRQFSHELVGEGVRDDSSTIHLLCTLFLI